MQILNFNKKNQKHFVYIYIYIALIKANTIIELFSWHMHHTYAYLKYVFRRNMWKCRKICMS